MSSTESVETEHSALRVPGLEATPQMKQCDRERFFEDVLQHDLNVFLSAAHLQMELKRPPINSISSMEVNVDVSEQQMNLLEFSDPEALDVFLSSAGNDGVITSPLEDGEQLEDVWKDVQVPGSSEHFSRMSSTSSTSTETYSSDHREEGAETPVVQSDDEGEADTFLLTAEPLTGDVVAEVSSFSL
ncbi:dysbindin-like [Arapaima gigas]